MLMSRVLKPEVQVNCSAACGTARPIPITHKDPMQMRTPEQRGFMGGAGLERAGEDLTMLTTVPIDLSFAHAGNGMHRM